VPIIALLSPTLAHISPSRCTITTMAVLPLTAVSTPGTRDISGAMKRLCVTSKACRSASYGCLAKSGLRSTWSGRFTLHAGEGRAARKALMAPAAVQKHNPRRRACADKHSRAVSARSALLHAAPMPLACHACLPPSLRPHLQ
jgi:hypothetical protein